MVVRNTREIIETATQSGATIRATRVIIETARKNLENNQGHGKRISLSLNRSK